MASMKPQWRLKVADFGRISAADVTLRRLTLLVGPNNSGKSYLASLLWGLVALQVDLPAVDCPEVAELDSWLQSVFPSGVSKGEFTIQAEDLGAFHRVFDVYVERGRDALIQRIFNSQQVSASQLSFQTMASRSIKVTWADAEGENRTHIVIDDGLEPHDGLKCDLHTDARVAELREVLVRRIVFHRLFRLFEPFNDSYSRVDPVYLPASRTGFVQLYRAPARRSLKNAFRAVAPEEFLDLTTPVFHFLDLLSFGIKQTRHSNYVSEAEFLEAGMDGRFEVSDNSKGSAINEYRYRPEGGGAVLPMKLSSSLVTELGPLVLVLRHARSMPLLVLEEPESHLHPSLQRRLAQAVVRLVRKGLCVWITTHSEDFCQQINNFIKLGSLSPELRARAQREFHFEEQDFLEQDDVAGNEFRIEDGRSVVSEMKLSAAGLVMPSFNREILDLSRQAIHLDGLLGEE